VALPWKMVAGAEGAFARLGVDRRTMIPPIGACDFLNLDCILWLESFEEHLPTIIAGVPSATLGTGSSAPRHKASVMR
jgi:hypothetical protein